ncbi:glycosyltransferase family 2 protein [Paenibacillus spiritus]|uniref:Glycosyltransferase family 2 protein n=1 Tax=Paenibacillus spiritus TaxID=2496557 RepID=A0A5J5FZM4_9BACL|nr:MULTISPECIES: glycosyltransferase family 2 protein [Paenibacillus]KAA8999495.1 glycosyltransferase family 2 protein [Paenibacillus spiritus]
MKPDVSILILNYNTCRLTLDCLRSVYDSATAYRYEVIVVDNHSSDGSVEAIRREFPQAVLIANEENVGFARGNNQAMKMAAGRYVLLLNSDTVVMPETLDTMIRFMDERPDIGASGCKIILPDGSLDKACKRGFPTPSASFYYAFGISKLFPDNPRYNGYQLGYLDPDQDYAVDALVGAFMMVRRETIAEVGGLDEEFFMYGEDLDWCYRIKEAGWGIWYYPRTSIIHLKGGSARRRPPKIIYEFHRAMILFHRKHYQAKYNVMVNGAVYAGVGVKLAAALLRNALAPKRPDATPVPSLAAAEQTGARSETKSEVRL